MTEKVRLGDYIKQIRGVSYTPKDIGDKSDINCIPIIRANNIQDDGLNFDDLIYINKRRVNSEQLIKRNDILVCSSSGSKNLVGKASIVKKDEDISFGAFCKIVRVSGNVEPMYIGHYFKSRQYRQIISNQSLGANINNLKNEHINNLLIPLPPLSEQHHIAKILDTSSSVIQNRKKQIALLDDLEKSLFVEMFGDTEQNQFNWQIKPLLETGNCKNGMNFSAQESGFEYNYLSVSDFKNLTKIDNVNQLGKISLNQIPKDDYFLKDGDIVFVRSNGNKELVGRCLAIYPKNIKTTFSGFCIRYRKTDDSLTIPYLTYLLKTEAMRKKMIGRGANIQNLNQKILSELKIPIPPLELQKEFADRIEKIEKQRLLLEHGLTKMEEAHAALMQKYFG